MDTQNTKYEKRRKLFAFDLNQENLKKYYPGKKPTYAYAQIGAFLYKQGFEHDQGSGYVSKEPMTDSEAVDPYAPPNLEGNTTSWEQMMTHIMIIVM